MAGASVLMLDLGRRTGWAALTSLAEDSGVHELYNETGSKASYDDGERFVAFHNFLTQLTIAFGRFDVIAFEQVNGGTRGRQTALYNGYRATLMAWCHMRGVVCAPLPVQTIKKVVTGSGKGRKEAVMAAVRGLGYAPWDDNEADAIAGLLTILSLGSKLTKTLDIERVVKHSGQHTVRGKKNASKANRSNRPDRGRKNNGSSADRKAMGLRAGVVRDSAQADDQGARIDGRRSKPRKKRETARPTGGEVAA